jgi:cytochrome c-type biogenesis protein CcsB
MQILFVLAILCYMFSSAGYFAYLFIQRDALQRTGIGLLVAGVTCQSVVIIWSFAQSGQMPVNNMHETLSLVAWALVGAFLILHLKLRVKILGVYAAPLAAFTLFAASQFPREPMQPQNLLKGFWLVVHIITVFIGDAGFALGCGVGVLYLIQERSIKSKSHGFFFKRLPSLDLLDSTGYACVVIGFTMLTIGLVTGMVFAKNVWGRFWSWDPKEVWSAVTWIFYAALLHERLTVGWRGRRAAIMAIVGFAVLLFTFLGVNILLKGHHGQFTRW